MVTATQTLKNIIRTKPTRTRKKKSFVCSRRDRVRRFYLFLNLRRASFLFRIFCTSRRWYSSTFSLLRFSFFLFHFIHFYFLHAGLMEIPTRYRHEVLPRGAFVWFTSTRRWRRHILKQLCIKYRGTRNFNLFLLNTSPFRFIIAFF